MTTRPADYAVGICQRTGFKVKASDLDEEWTGLMVRSSSLDPKHPSLDMPAPRGEDVRDNATGGDTVIERGDPGDIPALGDLGSNN